jgi:6-phosphogluconolactonase (cycloisomerase 2 family)
MSALSVGVVLSITSCVQSYTVGFLYVTGTVTAQSSGNGIITGFKIDHNTGKLNTINGLPVSSGGANPVRAVLLNGSRFLYVLNRGVTASGGADCTTADPCTGSNITVFAVGGNGILTQQEQFFTQGVNPFRIIADTSGSYIYVLDHDAPDSSAYTGLTPTLANPNSCMDELGNSTLSCGDITAFTVNQTTGRLSLLLNAQQTAFGGAPLTFFPVPANPVDFAEPPGYFITLSASPSATQSYPYTGGTSVFPYTFTNGTGQLSINQNTAQPLGIQQGTALAVGGNFLYVLDNEPIYLNGSTTAASQSQILPFSVGANGALGSQTGGAVPDDPSQSNPITLLVESKNKWLYVANQGVYSSTGVTSNGITGYVINPTTSQLSEMAGLPFTTGSYPQCLVEDPSDQFVYTANYYDSTVSGNSIDENSGFLIPLAQNHNVPSTYTLSGPATWCVMDGRTD